MKNYDEINTLVAYLQALVDVGKNSEVRVFNEIQRTIKKIEQSFEK